MKESDLNNLLIRGSGGGKGGGGSPTPRVAEEEPNTLRSKATLSIVEVISEGEILGLVDGAKSIFLDDTPIQNSDNSFNFAGITHEARLGTPDQDVINGFPDIQEEVAVGVKVEFATPIVRTISDLSSDAVRVTLRVPALTWQDPATGDLKSSWVGYKIELQANGGGYVTQFDSFVEGKTTAPYEFSFRVNFGSSTGPWDIRVSRTREDNEQVNRQNDLFWSRYTRIVDDKLIYMDTAIVGLKVDSSLFGNSIPTRSYDIQGIKIKVPVNYTVSTRAYSGIWDGTFKTEWSDNPAWVLYDLITNDRYGLGQYIDAAEVDKFAFYTIAQYCDELIDDGNGGTEPRFTFNGVIESQAEALKVIQSVASTFRGMLFWGSEGNSGVVVPVVDSPKDAVKIFSQANVIDGLLTYSGSALTARHSVIYVTWSDPANAYKPSVEVVEDPTLIDLYGFRKTDIVAYGCTSRGQANRLGKWVLESEANETETVNFKVSIADADVRPGDIIQVYDDSYADIRYGGRVVSATLNSVTADSTITIEGAKTYTLSVILDNGVLEEQTITNSPGDYTVLTLGANLADIPSVNGMWAITASDLAPREFRVITVSESEDIEFEISALLHDANKYARIEQNLNLPELTFSRLRVGVLLPPTDLTLTEYLYRAGASIQSAVSLSWATPSDDRVVGYEVEFKRPGDSGAPAETLYEFAGSTRGVSFDIKDTEDGLWNFRVRAFDALGNYSAYLEVTARSLIINSTPPDDIATFNITNIGDTSVLKWGEVFNLNVSHYEIRFSALLTGATWAASAIIVNAVPTGSTTVTVPSRSGTYLIKAVTIATEDFPNGIFSVAATSISTNVDSLVNFNFVESVIEEPVFSGVKTDVLKDGDAIILDIVSDYDWDAIADVDTIANADNNGFAYVSEGTYNFANTVDLTAVYTNRLTSSVTVNGLNSENNVDTWADVDAIENVDDVSESDFDIQLQVRTTEDDPGGSPTWTDWLDFEISDYVARAFEFRLKMFSFNSTVTPQVTVLQVQVDMPDSLRSGNDLAVPVNGQTYTYAPAFRSANPSVAIAAQDLAQGDYWVITNKAATGFKIEFFNSSDASISRTFDYVARGYGYLNA